eukprot:9334623-Pyramimonas_sp.AAC.1
MYVDGALSWSLPTNRWAHLHLEAGVPFAARLTLMGQSQLGDSTTPAGTGFKGNLKGKVAEVYVWNRQLTAGEVSTIAG